MRMWRSGPWLAALALLHGCEVGRSIVDQGDTQPVPTYECELYPGCEPILEAPKLDLPDGTACSVESCEIVQLDTLPREGADLAGAVLQLASEAPKEVSLRAARLRDVRIELSGPVTLRFEADSSLDGVDVWLSAAGGEPELRAENAQLNRVNVQNSAGERSAQPLGRLSIERSELTASALRARTLELASCHVRSSRLESDSLVSADVALQGSELSFGRGIVAGTDFDRVITRACGTLLFSYGVLLRAQLACEGLLRVYSADVFDSQLDGNVQGDDAYVQDSQIGLASTSAVDLWGSTLDRVSLCAHAHDLQIGRGSAAACVDCDDAPELQACRIDEDPPRVRDNACRPLEKALDECEKPWPSRERPRTAG